MPEDDGPIAAIALASGAADDLAHIAGPAIALAQWWRSPVVAIPAEDLATLATLRLEGDPTEAEASVVEALAEGPPRPWHAPLAADVGALARRFAAIAGCDEVALRLERVEGDACRRFHTDYVPLRLLTTYVGPGTEWTLTAGEEPIVHRMATGHVGLFKGRGSGRVGLLHRSPPIADRGERRLLLVIDPLADEDDPPPPR